jgi:hypothetical protein
VEFVIVVVLADVVVRSVVKRVLTADTHEITCLILNLHSMLQFAVLEYSRYDKSLLAKHRSQLN